MAISDWRPIDRTSRHSRPVDLKIPHSTRRKARWICGAAMTTGQGTTTPATPLAARSSRYCPHREFTRRFPFFNNEQSRCLCRIGGCVLRIPADEISILRIVESIDGPLRLIECLTSADDCARASCCRLRTLLVHLQEEMARVLGSATVASLALDGAIPLPCRPVGGCRCDP